MTRMTLPVAATALLLLSACSSGAEAVPVATVSDQLQAINEEAAAREAEAATALPVVQDPASSASIQICIDTAADGGAERASRLLNAVADSLDEVVHVDEDWVSALNVEAWAASGDGGLLLEGSIPEIRDVELVAGLDAAAQAKQLEEQAEQRRRVEPITEMAAALSAELHNSVVAPGQDSDVLGCVSRANDRMLGRDAARRLLIVASDMPVGYGSTYVNGSLSETRQVLVLGWGPDLARRSELWLSTWESLGASPDSNLHRYEFDDGIGQVLANAITTLVPS